ncbi:hypothetical protein RIF29_08095 [Crotalaria pallida]|uniref:CASP-like protein n=1 Tax=Crotalaria pallida TaxID=3830 RepID=A0AAN9J4W4_CROPI
MASSGDPEFISSSTPLPPDGNDNYFKFDVILRFLLFAASLVTVVVMVTSNETKLVLFQGIPVPQPAKFGYSPAFIYFVTAFSVSGLYSIITTLASLSVVKKPHLKTNFLLHFIFWDSLILGIIASATGAVGGVAYVGLKGNKHLGWGKICGTYDKFCSHTAGSFAVALFGCVVTLLLIWLSAYAMQRRIPK